MQFWQMPQPLCASPATLVPTAYFAATFCEAFRSSESATTSPAHSCPIRAGKLGGHMPGNLPATILGSVPQMATALTRQSTSSPLGCGVGTVSIEKSLGPCRMSAFMVPGISARAVARPGWAASLSLIPCPFQLCRTDTDVLMATAQRRACAAAARSSGSGKTSAESQPP